MSSSECFWASRSRSPRSKFQLAVALKSSGQLIGNCGIRKDSFGAREADIGYELSLDHWGHGYATEAAGASTCSTCGQGIPGSAKVCPSCGRAKGGQDQLTSVTDAESGVWTFDYDVRTHRRRRLVRREPQWDDCGRSRRRARRQPAGQTCQMTEHLPGSGLAELFRYHEWATLALLDHALTVTEPQLVAPGTTSVGSIYECFGHVLMSEGWSLRRLGADRTLPAAPRDKEIESLGPIVAAHTAVWLVVIADPTLLGSSLAAQGAIPKIRDAGIMLALQAIHHGELHRTDLRATFAAIGHPVPGRDTTDVWAFWESRGKLGGPL